MVICFKIGLVEHCYYLPVVAWPPWTPPGPPINNYPAFIRDVTLVATAQNLATHIEDGAVREALLGGVREALGLAQERGGGSVRVSEAP